MMGQLKLKVKKVGSRNPINKQLGFTARVLTNGKAAFDDVVREAGRNTTMHRAELRMAFELCIDTVTELLKKGLIIELGPLGKIYPSCTSKWYVNEDDMKLGDVKPQLYFRAGEDVESAVKAAKLMWAKGSEERADNTNEGDPVTNSSEGEGSADGGGGSLSEG